MRKALRESNKKSKSKPKKKITKQDITKHKNKIIFIAVALIIIVFIVCINNYVQLGLVINKNIDSDDVIEVELTTSNNKIIPYGNKILVFNKGVLKSYNNHGKQEWKVELEDTIDADISTCGQYIQIVNKDKSIVYVYKNKYEVARIKIEGEIYSGSINKQGTSVIEYTVNGNKTELGIYNNSGEKKYNIKLSNDIIGKYVLIDNSKKLAYIDVNASGISVQTNINVINLDSVTEENNGIQTIYTVENDLVYDIYWIGNSLVAKLVEEYVIYNCNNDKKDNVNVNVGQLVNVDEYKDRYAYIKLDEQANYYLGICKMFGEKSKIIAIKDSPKYFKYVDGVAYVCYSNKIEAYNNLGMNIKNYNSDIVLTEPVVFNNGRSVAIVIANKLILFTI